MRVRLLGPIVAAVAAIAALALLVPREAGARPELRWCTAIWVDGGALECHYDSFRQCLAAVSGVGGHCVQNPRLGPWVSDEDSYSERKKTRKRARPAS